MTETNDFDGFVDFDFDEFNEDEWENEGNNDIPVEETDEDNFIDELPPSKRNMCIFFLIDTSGSMGGTKIGTVNSTMEELLPELIGLGGTETDIKIAVMKFDTNVEWITPEPVLVEQYQQWRRLTASGTTHLGDAFKELSSKMSRSAFMNVPALSYAPVIFLMSDGAPNDDWKSGLDQLKRNNWYKNGLKIAVGIGSEVNMDVLKAFTGRDELCTQVHNAEKLKEMINFLVVTSTMIGSKSINVADSIEEKTEESVAHEKEERLINEIISQDIMNPDIDDIDMDDEW